MWTPGCQIQWIIFSSYANISQSIVPIRHLFPSYVTFFLCFKITKDAQSKFLVAFMPANGWMYNSPKNQTASTWSFISGFSSGLHAYKAHTYRLSLLPLPPTVFYLQHILNHELWSHLLKVNVILNISAQNFIKCPLYNRYSKSKFSVVGVWLTTSWSPLSMANSWVPMV